MKVHDWLWCVISVKNTYSLFKRKTLFKYPKLYASRRKKNSCKRKKLYARTLNFIQVSETLCKHPKRHSSVRNFMQASKTSFKSETSCKHPKLHSSVQNFMQAQNLIQVATQTLCERNTPCKLRAALTGHDRSRTSLGSSIARDGRGCGCIMV